MHFHCLPSWLQRRLRDVGFEPRGLGREALDVRDEARDLLVRRRRGERLLLQVRLAPRKDSQVVLSDAFTRRSTTRALPNHHNRHARHKFERTGTVAKSFTIKPSTVHFA